MKQFFKFMFASMFGVLLSLVIAFFLFAGIIGSMVSASQTEKTPSVKSNTVLQLKLNKPIKDYPSNDPFENIDFTTFDDNTPYGILQILNSIEKAKHDERIKGIYMDISGIQASMASIEEIRNALLNFKESGKFIISYSEYFGQASYYLATVADKIVLNPAGELSFKGLSAQNMFFKDALEKLDVEMQVIRHGKFKSAIEPFIRNDMSEANKQQNLVIVSSIWGKWLNNISSSRGISVDKLNTYADNLTIGSPSSALENGFIDAVLYKDQVLDNLNEMVDAEPNFMTLKKYSKVKGVKIDSSKFSVKSKNRISIVYAEGEIVSGKSKQGAMGSETIVEAIRTAKEDSRTKAIILRINSPGGSALASEVIWRELVLAKEEKPVYVSMGGVAASGGYFIAAPANKIYAESTTITGSIGVFGLIPNMSGLFNNKLGIHFDQVNTNTYADGLSTARALSEKEKEVIQASVEEVYDSFTKKVAEGRGMSQTEVDKIGQGRVWSGLNAIEIGLVDEIGGLKDVISFAVENLELSDYKVVSLPKQEDPIEKLVKDFTENAQLKIFGSQFGKAEKYYGNIKRVMDANGIYTRMPVDIIIE